MHENASKTTTSASLDAIKTAILQAINVRPIDSSDSSYLRFAALTFSGKLPILLTLKVTDEGTVQITVNCEKIVFGSMIMKVAKETINSL